jgi:molybdopterin-biosynthesis enzyme MoeA-like protein
MQGMLASLDGKLKSGPIIHSHTVRAYTGESSIADALAKIQDQHPDADVGSYPFFRDERYGTNLVIRGPHVAQLRTIANLIMDAVKAIGEPPEDLGQDAET